ncbi:uncharacterized protein STEHIDRAFT_49802, partial [Stereum hirsutum FP-91666 SS1]|uniref:uncharacterized protein n=1 Tax=Stereum hirsutum (strain FP-91666) TaxID=721885 RepID=UPI000440E10C
IIDPHRRLLGVLGGHPDDPNWHRDVLEPATALLEQTRLDGDAMDAWTEKQHDARRGDFVSLTAGVSYGGGQQEPGNLKPEKVCQVPLVGRLLRSKPIRRMAGFANSAFMTYAPKLYKQYAEETEALYSHDPSCRRPFKNAVWPACTFNLGPQCCCRGHCDSANVPHGWCAVWALGDYDPKVGGHLILLEFGLIIQFPPGSVILLPSSTIRHGNTPVGPTEHRYSFTMYCAGGIFRWVHHGFVPEWVLTDDQHREAYGRHGQRWMEALGKYSVLEDLADDYRACFGGSEDSDDEERGSDFDSIS